VNMYKRTLAAIRPYWKQLALASGSAALNAMFSGLLVWLGGPLMMSLFRVQGMAGMPDVATPTTPLPTGGSGFWGSVASAVAALKDAMKGMIDQWVASDTRSGMLLNFCILILAVVLAKNFFMYFQGFFTIYVQQSMMKNFRDRLFEKYQRLSLDYFHQRRTGQVMSRITNDVVVLNESIDLGFNRLVTDSIFVLLLFSFLVILSWKLTLMAMIVLPMVFGFIWFIGKTMRRYSARSQERMADVNSVLEEAVSNIRIVKAFSMEQFEAGRFFGATYRYFRALLRMARIRALASPINDTLTTIAGVSILLFAGSQIMSGKGELDAGDFMTFILAMFSLIKPVKSLSDIHVRLQEGMAAADRIFEVLDTPEQIADKPDARTIGSFQTEIRYEHVSFAYNTQEPVLVDISFEVKKGEVVALVGPSGAGKSTMFDLLPRFYDPQEGRITIDGLDIRDLTLSSLRGLMGIVTQETFLFNDTIFNNIAYGMTGVAEERVIEAARVANAHEFIMQFEKGYQTVVGNRGEMLSGGQRQRLAIARALLKNPEVLIFDEATSSLDTESEVLVQEAIDRLMSNRTTLVIAHRLSTIKHATRIMVLSDGRIRECGTHADLMQQGGLYARLYAMQFRNDD